MPRQFRYSLHDDVSYCQADDGLVFLDVRRDRYFRLPHDLEMAFVACITGEHCPKEAIEILMKQNIVNSAMSATRHHAEPAIPDAARSSLEMVKRQRETSASIFLEVLSIVLLIRHRLKRNSLKEVLDYITSYRLNRAPQTTTGNRGLSKRCLVDAANDFRRARLYVPVGPVCLLDSLAMTMFFARRGLHTNIVFGITADPFTAHCWTQSGNLLLNDTVGHANGYTRIRVV